MPTTFGVSPSPTLPISLPAGTPVLVISGDSGQTVLYDWLSGQVATGNANPMPRLAPVPGPSPVAGHPTGLSSGDGGYCVTYLPDSGPAGPVPLYYFGAGGNSRLVGVYGTAGEQTGVRVLACSPAGDRAVLVRTCVVQLCEVWTVRLSDGALLYHGSLPPAVGSPQALLTNLAGDRCLLVAPARQTTEVRRCDTWQLLRTLSLATAVLDASGRLVAGRNAGGGLSILELETGREVWSTSSPVTDVVAGPFPGVFAFGVAAAGAAPSEPWAEVRVWRDGMATKVESKGPRGIWSGTAV